MGWTTNPDGSRTWVPDGEDSAGSWRIVTGADGRQYVVDASGAATLLQGDNGPIYAPRSETGLSFDQQYALATAPRSSSSVSLMDPASYQIQLAQLELARQKAAAEQALAMGNLRLAQDVARLNQQNGDRQAALDIARFAESIAARVEQQQFAQVQLTSQIQQVNAQMQFAAAQANAQAQATALQINEQRRQTNLDARRTNALDIAELSKDPGDRAALAAYLAARGNAQGSLGTAIAQGADFRTEASLSPLREMLGLRDELAQGPQLYTAPNISAPQLPLPQFAPQTGLAAGAAIPGLLPQVPQVPRPVVPQAGTTGGAAAAAQVPAYLQPGGDPYTPEAQDRWQQGVDEGSIVLAPEVQGGSDEANAIAQNAADLFTPDASGQDFTFHVDESGTLVATPMFERGGVTASNSVIVGDSSNGRPNPEMVTRLPDGRLLVLPIRGKLPPRNRVPRAEDGAIVGSRPAGLPTIPAFTSSAANNGQNANNDSARAFLNSTFGSAVQGTPWQGGVPTPISVSNYGTSPFLQQMAAGLAASGRGIAQQLFGEEIARLRPISLNRANVIGRSA